MTDIPPSRVVTWRSVLLGLVGVGIICGLTPYNDYALNNTYLVGNNLPVGAVMLLFVLAVLVNGPVNRFRPKWALDSGEIALAFSMTLVSCALPSSGLMRYFMPTLVAPFILLGGQADYTALFRDMHLPRWLFPAYSGPRPRDWVTDPIATGYYERWIEAGRIPYAAWVRPAIAWGIFFFALYGALLCLTAIVRRQWFENERLPFPLAQIELALVERPAPGKMLNSILGRQSFWIAFGAVFLLQIWRGLAEYQPKYFPDIPVKYDLIKLLSNPPWSYLDLGIRSAQVYFTVVGVTYFLPGAMAFSLWFIAIALGIARMIVGSIGGDPTLPALGDETFGGTLAFALAVIWVGRRHWWLVMRQAFRGERAGEPRGRYLSYPVAFWVLVGCAAVMVAWLAAAGCTLVGAVAVVLLLLLGFMVITRFVAEAGLVHGACSISIVRPFDMIAGWGWGQPVPVQTYYLASMLQTTFYDYREVVPVYASHGMWVTDRAAFGGADVLRDSRGERATGRKFMAALLLALVVGYGVSFFSTLWTEYHYAVTQDVIAEAPINSWGESNVKYQLMDSSVRYHEKDYSRPYNAPAHFAGGFVFAAALGFLRWRFAWWPLHPIGFLILGSYASAVLWFSTLIGWLLKVVILRFGGAKRYTNAKPFFVGMIVGETAAAGVWVGVGVVLSMMKLPYRPIRLMPW